MHFWYDIIFPDVVERFRPGIDMVLFSFDINSDNLVGDFRIVLKPSNKALYFQLKIPLIGPKQVKLVLKKSI